MEIKPFKIRDLTPEKSKIVQETLFKNGYKWANSSVSIQFLDSKHLILRNNQLYQGNNNDVFDYDEYRNIPELTFEEFERMYIKEEFVLPENWYVIVTKENRNILSKWRYENDNVLLPIHFITGMCKNDNGKVTKEHNGINGIKGDTYDFGKKITFDQFKRYVLKEEIIQDTLKVEDLVEGEIYFGEYVCCDIIFKPRQCELYNNISFFKYNNPTYITKLRVATQEEKQWLEACILANKFIPKEEALKSKKMKFEIGKWYKAIDGKSKITSKWYVKNKFENDILDSFRETICAGEYQKRNVNLGYIGTYNYVEIPLSEIQQYLPEGHPDKFIQVEYHSLTSKNHLENAFNQSISSKKKSYIPIYTEPTTVKNVENEITLIRKVNKVKIIKINNYGN